MKFEPLSRELNFEPLSHPLVATHEDDAHRTTAVVYAKFGKRAFDIIFVLAILPALLPLTAILWLMVKSDGGPGFFGHMRIGQNGKPFRCWKLRSMRPDATAVLQAHLDDDPVARRQWTIDHKLNRDPRITSLGRFLRRTSLDELPQFYNVLRGDMSVVGPRPVTRPELDRYGQRVAHYLAMKPGITGLWQVSGRNNTGYARRVTLDCRYGSIMSFPNDLWIIARTVVTVIKRTGL